MDFSKKYIKMCERAKKIQEIWKPCLGDYLYDKFSGHTKVLTTELYWQHQEDPRVDLVKCNGFIWLPRQDQLQEIFCEEYEGGKDLWDAFYDFLTLKSTYIGKYIGMYSAEKLFLAFVMLKRFKKVWDDRKEEWEVTRK